MSPAIPAATMPKLISDPKTFGAARHLGLKIITRREGGRIVFWVA